ncbi:hypothetical protein DWB68_06260 [Galactobacter valiniphilus]|uniref:SF3 helicase domain-containing protein n=2 Tax=Galactobacter valiniphilus TaxID=2676122 RepID=A0A399JBW9_9MICC|nr:hypothetical protein DWB68_06260 [Galactobacter valiniphilus]
MTCSANTPKNTQPAQPVNFDDVLLANETTQAAPAPMVIPSLDEMTPSDEDLRYAAAAFAREEDPLGLDRLLQIANPGTISVCAQQPIRNLSHLAPRFRAHWGGTIARVLTAGEVVLYILRDGVWVPDQSGRVQQMVGATARAALDEVDYLMTHDPAVVRSLAAHRRVLEDPSADEDLRYEAQAAIDKVRARIAAPRESLDDMISNQAYAWTRVVNGARSEVFGEAAFSERDTDPYALNTPNGLLDLRTLKIREITEADGLITCITSGVYLRPEERKPAPGFERAIRHLRRQGAAIGRASLPSTATQAEIEAAEKRHADEIEDFYQRALGYSISGKPSRSLGILTGAAGAGKTTLVQLACEALGGSGSDTSYAGLVSPGVLHTDLSDSNKPLPGVLDLGSKRLVLVDEADNHYNSSGIKKKVSASTLKLLVQSAPVVRARGVFGKKPVALKIKASFFVSVNDTLAIAGIDKGIEDRLLPSSWPVPVPADEVDDDAIASFSQDDKDALLSWLIDGFQMAWRHDQIKGSDRTPRGRYAYQEWMKNAVAEAGGVVDQSECAPFFEAMVAGTDEDGHGLRLTMGAWHQLYSMWRHSVAPSTRTVGLAEFSKAMKTRFGDEVTFGRSYHQTTSGDMLISGKLLAGAYSTRSLDWLLSPGAFPRFAAAPGVKSAARGTANRKPEITAPGPVVAPTPAPAPAAVPAAHPAPVLDASASGWEF